MTHGPEAARFDAYLIVDWSAASRPCRGKDSIWLGLTVRRGGEPHLALLENPATRAAATERIGALLGDLLAAGQRVLAGFDFPFGYPAGTAGSLGLPGLAWRHTWQLLTDHLADDDRNRNTRLAVADMMNRRISGAQFPFWGNGSKMVYPNLSRFRPLSYGSASVSVLGPGLDNATSLMERRLAESRLRHTQPVWKLAGVGSVGSQALTGIPRVWQLRCDARLAMAASLWPFETGLADDPRARLVFAEVYPSIVPPLDLPGLPKDAGQVAAAGRHFARLDAAGRMGALLAGDPALSAAERRIVEAEEAWILGLTARVETLEEGSP